MLSVRTIFACRKLCVDTIKVHYRKISRIVCVAILLQHANISKLKAVYAVVESSPGRQTAEPTPRDGMPMLKIYYLSVQIVQLLCCSFPVPIFRILELSHVCSIRFLRHTRKSCRQCLYPLAGKLYALSCN